MIREEEYKANANKYPRNHDVTGGDRVELYTRQEERETE